MTIAPAEPMYDSTEADTRRNCNWLQLRRVSASVHRGGRLGETAEIRQFDRKGGYDVSSALTSWA